MSKISNTKTKANRSFSAPIQRWSETQTKDLLQSVAHAVMGNIESFQKPTCQNFYENISSKTTSLANLTWVVMQTKMRTLKTSYFSAVEWKLENEIRLMGEGKESSIQEYINKICPHFQLLEQIFGQPNGFELTTTYSISDEVTVQQLHEKLEMKKLEKKQEMEKLKLKHDLEIKKFELESRIEIEKLKQEYDAMKRRVNSSECDNKNFL